MGLLGRCPSPSSSLGLSSQVLPRDLLRLGGSDFGSARYGSQCSPSYRCGCRRRSQACHRRLLQSNQNQARQLDCRRGHLAGSLWHSVLHIQYGSEMVGRRASAAPVSSFSVRLSRPSAKRSLKGQGWHSLCRAHRNALSVAVPTQVALDDRESSAQPHMETPFIQEASQASQSCQGRHGSVRLSCKVDEAHDLSGVYSGFPRFSGAMSRGVQVPSSHQAQRSLLVPKAQAPCLED